MSDLKNQIILLSSLLVLAACSSTPKAVAPIDSAAAAPKAKVLAPQKDPLAVATIDMTAAKPADATLGTLANRSVYFAYDSYQIQNEYSQSMNKNALYLEKNHAQKIVIQGNADERGGSEYNLALGQKRAEAVRKSLSLLGVPSGQMEAVSFGKEKPKAAGHDENAWAENRRADIVYSPK